MDYIRIEYDDTIEDVIERVNELLSSHGIRLVGDEEEHDGYMIYTVGKKL